MVAKKDSKMQILFPLISEAKIDTTTKITTEGKLQETKDTNSTLTKNTATTQYRCKTLQKFLLALPLHGTA